METFTGTLTALEKKVDMLTNKEEEFTGNMETLVAMMLQDGRNNDKYASNILWWVDVCAQEVLPSVVAAMVQNFGLPDDVANNFYSDYLTPEKEVNSSLTSPQSSHYPCSISHSTAIHCMPLCTNYFSLE